MAIDYNHPLYAKQRGLEKYNAMARKGQPTRAGFDALDPTICKKIFADEIDQITQGKTHYSLSKMIPVLFEGHYTAGRDPKKLLEDLSDIPDSILDDIRRKESFLIYEHGDPGEGFLHRIFKNLCVVNKIPSSQIIIVSHGQDYEFLVPKIAKIYGVEPCHVVLYNHFDFWMKTRFIREFQAYGIDVTKDRIRGPLENENPEKIYLNLNQAWRLHRAAFISHLNDAKLLDYGYNSFVGVPEILLGNCFISSNEQPSIEITDIKEIDHDLYKKYFNGDDNQKKWAALMYHSHRFFKEPLRTSILDGMDIFDKFPMFVDSHKNNIYETPDKVRTLLPYLKNSYFSIINETYYSQDYDEQIGNKYCRFLTEKTFKAIACRHPFILLTVSNSLELLHKMGYQTFHPYINEDYDKEPDDSKRMLMVSEEIKRWTTLDKATLNNYRKKLIDIVEYNYDLFINKEKYVFRLL